MGHGKAMQYFTLRACTDCDDERLVHCRKAEQGTVMRRRCGRCHSIAVCSKYLGATIATPRDDIDEMAVERIIGGDRKVGNIAERIEATVILAARGLSAADIAARIGVTPRTIERYKAEARSTGRLSQRRIDWSDKAIAA